MTNKANAHTSGDLASVAYTQYSTAQEAGAPTESTAATASVGKVRRKRKAKSAAQRATFKAYQEKKQADRKDRISVVLSTLKHGKAKFEYLTDLAKTVAELLTAEEGKPCSTSTLLRNSEYRELLAAHFDSGGKSNARRVSTAEAVEAAMTRAAVSEHGRLAQELQEAGNEIKHLRQSRAPLLEISGASIEAPAGANVEDTVVELHKLLLAVVNNFEGILCVDKDRNIVDRSNRNRIIGKIPPL